MSRSNQSNLVNPAKKFLQWRGEIKFTEINGKIEKTDRHCFSYYDATKKEEPCKGQMELNLPVTFLVLDILHTIKGYNESAKAGFYSNEIRGDMWKTHPFKVRCGKDDFTEGLYAEIKDEVKGAGGKYCQSVYALMKEEGVWVINNFQFTGTARDSWMEFCKKNDIEKCAVTVKTWTVGEKGNNKFNVPVFEAVPVSKDTDDIAIAEDREILQPYFKSYFEKQGTPQKEEKPEYASSAEDITPDDDLPY